MHASGILHRCLGSGLAPMHAARRRRLLQAVDALIGGRKLTLTDLARSWPGATWMHAPLKALDRLLSNLHLSAAVPALHQSMAAWLLSGPRPLILVDWTDLKGYAHGCVLRAAVPMGGRALTLYEQVYPIEQLSKPSVQAEFLRALKRLVPESVRPIVVTDAGFRSDWCREVVASGWDYVARIRHNTQVRAPDGHWQGCKSLFALTGTSPKDLGSFDLVKCKPMRCRLLLAGSKRPRSQEPLPRMRSSSKKACKAAREPWLLATTLSAREQTAAQVMKIYGHRMQIEEAFRDLKSHRYGVGFEDSLTRKPARIAILLLLHTLASFAAWAAGCSGKSADLTDPMTRQSAQHGRYSVIRCGFEWLRLGQLNVAHLIAWLRTHPPRSPTRCAAGAHP